MINRIFWLALAFVVCCSSEARITYDLYRKGALAKVRIKVVDQDGVIVPGAKIWGAFITGSGFNDYALIDGVTDTNGVFVARNRCNGRLRFDVRKEGYYRTEENVRFWDAKKDPTVIDGKWQPYGETRTVVLKSIVNPVRLRDLDAPSRYKYPELGKWAAFDLEHCDWVAPLGTGTHADVLLKFSRESRSDGFLKGMEVSFTNNPHAGVYLMGKDSYSEMNSVYTASTNAQFVGNLRYEFERTAKGNHVISELGSGQYLVFRTRTKVDRNGKLLSAHYGRIMGEWRYVEKGGMAFGAVFFNPTPNDTNLEDAETARRSRLGYKQSLEFEKARKR